MEKRNSVVYIVDGILLVGTLFILMYVVGYVQPLVISPLDNFETTEEVLFSIEKAERILIDTSLDFSNPLVYELKDGLEIGLEPGEYFWRAEGLAGIKTEVRNLKILSKIELKLMKTEEGYNLVNSGNTRLNVDVYEEENYVKSFKLDSGEKVSDNQGNKFFGRWIK